MAGNLRPGPSPLRLRLRTDRLRHLVDQGRISQNHWAIRLGLSRGHWSDLLNGRHPFPSRRTRERLLEVFGVAEAELFLAETDPDTPDERSFRQAVSGRFTLDEVLGQGATGIVYGAQDVRLGRMVAVKVVQPEAAAGVGAERLLQELAHAARLHHPHILPLLDAGMEAGQPYLVMPLIRGGSLRELLTARTRLPLGEALGILDGVARALAYAHSRQVLHCDVKPENILVQDGHPYVMDFGIAQRLHAEADEWRGIRRDLGFSAGTPAYVSPEQAAGDAIDQRSDVYSLACVAYELLSGRLPFEGTSTRETVSLRFRNPPPPLREGAPDVPQGVADVIARGMALTPDRRPDSTTAFVAELHAAAARGSRVAVATGVALTRGLTRLRSRLGIEGPARLQLPFTGVVHDMLHTLRGLRRDWRFALGIVLSLGLGLGVGLPVLGLADQMLLRAPAGIAAPDRVLRLVKQSENKGRTFFGASATGLDYATFAEMRSFEGGAAAMMPLGVSIGRGREARPFNAVLASANYFATLGTPLHLGRSWTAAEDVVGAASAPIVISHRFWRREYDARPDALGRILHIGEVDYVVSGVAPEGFNGTGLTMVDLYLPIHVAAPIFQGNDPSLWTTDRSAWLRLVGRLRDGVTVQAAEAEADALYRRPGTYVRDVERTNRMRLESLLPGRALQPSASVGISRWLSGGALLLLVLIWANLTNLFVARAGARARESAIRIAIGGGAGQLARLFAVEALVLAGAGALLGLVLAGPGTTFLRQLLFRDLVWARPAIDWRMVGLAALLTLLSAGLATGAALIRTARTDPNDLLRAAGSNRGGAGAGAGRTRSLMLAAQGAVFAVLLLGALAFVQSIRRAVAIDHGFRLEGLEATWVPTLENNDSASRRYDLTLRAAEEIRRLPGVRSTSVAYMMPWQNNAYDPIFVAGFDSVPQAMFDAASPEHLATMGMRMRQGRWIGPEDLAGSEPVAVVNETMARTLWAGESALGKCFRVRSDTLPCHTVVGVVADARMTGGLDSKMESVYYLPTTQMLAYGRSGALKIFVRRDPAAAPLDAAIAATFQRLAPDVGTVPSVRLDAGLDFLFAPLRLGLTAFSIFGVLAGLVAAIGLAGVLSYLIQQQRHAFAVRLALGAPAFAILRPLIGRTLLLVGGGMLAGLLLVAPFRGRIEGILYQTRAFEPLLVGATLTLGLLVAFLAAAIPMRGALRIEPMRVLRDE